MDERSDEMIASKVYPKDSFDRFGDDLCEVLLSYLPFEDRFRCECVAKQWQTLIFTTQTDLIYNKKSNYKLNIESFEWMVKKCPNITVIQMDGFISGSIKLMFDLIIKYCHRLHTFCVSYFPKGFIEDNEFTADIVNKFFAKFAKQLKIFKLDEDLNDKVMETIVENMKSCHNITYLDQEWTISLGRFWPVLNVPNEILYPKLQEMLIRFNDQFSNEVFVDNYKNQLKVIKLYVGEDETSIDKLFNALLQMHQLIALHFGVYNTYFVTHLRPIGLQLKQLKSLAFSICYNLIPNDWTLMLKIISQHFKHLKRLSFNMFRYYLPMNGLTSKRLTHLTIKTKNYDIEDEFWDTIHTNLPKLQYISVRQILITDNVLTGLSLVPKLRYIRLKGGKQYTQTGLKNLMDKSSKAVISIHHRPYYPDND